MASGWYTRMGLCQTGKKATKAKSRLRRNGVSVMTALPKTYGPWVMGKPRKLPTGTEFDVSVNRASKGTLGARLPDGQESSPPANDAPPAERTSPDAQETGENGHTERKKQTDVTRPGSRYVWKLALLSPPYPSPSPARDAEHLTGRSPGSPPPGEWLVAPHHGPDKGDPTC